MGEKRRKRSEKASARQEAKKNQSAEWILDDAYSSYCPTSIDLVVAFCISKKI